MTGDYPAAASQLEDAIALCEDNEDTESALRYGQDDGVSTRCYLSWALWHLGFPERATEVVGLAVSRGQQLGHKHTLAYGFLHAAIGAWFSRNARLAAEYAGLSFGVAEQHGFPLWLGLAEIVQGWATAKMLPTGQGIEQIRNGLVRAQSTGSGWAEPLFFCMLAEALAQRGREHEGLAAIDEGLAISADFGQALVDAELHRLRGELLWRLPVADFPAVEASLQQAVAVARRQGSRGFELRAATSLAQLWAEQGTRGEARELLSSLHGWFTEGFKTPDLKGAKRLLEKLAGRPVPRG